MRQLFDLRPTRAVEATPEQLVATGALIGGYGRDPIDGDVGYVQAGNRGRTVPYWTLEKARAAAVASYRSNPMCRAIVDTYTSFCVGDKGVSLQVTNDDVRKVALEFWNDPKVRLGAMQDLMLRDQMIMGEQVLELLVGRSSGVVRFSPIDPQRVAGVELIKDNPLWPGKLIIRTNLEGERTTSKTVAQVNDNTGLREGEAMFWTPFKTLLTDTRSMSFLTPILDWLDSYDMVLSNLIDRTALARYMVWDVTVVGGNDAVTDFIQQRGGTHLPASGSVEVHNESVTWKAQQAQTGAFEDTAANASVLTQIASGAGLAKHWLAEPEHTNRATSNSMAEPVRRRLSGVQGVWLDQMTELVRFAIDRAVAAKRLPKMVSATDASTGEKSQVPAAMTVMVTGPEIAAADAQINAEVLLNLSTGLMQLMEAGALSREAAQVAARKAWEDYVGVPYVAELDGPDTDTADLATHIDTTQGQAGAGGNNGANVRPLQPRNTQPVSARVPATAGAGSAR